MNSIQHISKLKGKAADLLRNLESVFGENYSLKELDKELLKKSCVDIYELVMKLKAEGIAVPEPPAAPREQSRPPVPEQPRPQPVEVPVEPKLELPFVELVEEPISPEETLNSIEQKVMEQESQPAREDEGYESTIRKIVEDKRIQYTVMPPQEHQEEKPVIETVEKNEPLSFNERFAPQVHTELRGPRIDNLKTAITLNRKIAFVNDLFRENVLEYAKSIDRLNSASGLDEAMAIFEELRENHGWSKDNEMVRELEDLVKRRF